VPVLTFPLDEPVSASIAAELVKESVYIAPGISGFVLRDDNRLAEVTIDDAASRPVVEDKVRRYLDIMLARFRTIEPSVYAEHRRPGAHAYHADVFGELQRREWLFPVGAGAVSLAGPALALHRALDRLFAKTYAAAFATASRSFPASLPAELLHACGYFDSHPNMSTFATHLVEDLDVIEAFREANEETERYVSPPAASFAPPDVCLVPAACFPCYPTYRGRTLGDDGVALSWQGRIFRQESRNATGLSRLREFNVRELVFIGTESFVLAARRGALELVDDLFRRCELSFTIATASDPFFATVTAAKTFWQQSQEVKHEIIMPYAAADGASGDGGADATVAVGSVNYHENFFGRRFEIRARDGELAHTACVGIGIERLMLAVFAQHGFAPAGWPRVLAEALAAASEEA
jgi:seryl-tRNA synthetase